MSGFGLSGGREPYRAAGAFGPLARLMLPLFESTGYDVRPGISCHLKPFFEHFPQVRSCVTGNYGIDLLEARRVALATKKAVVCFSGGKDSTAAIVKLQRTGHRVTGFYVEGANKSYTNERGQCDLIAKALGITLAVAHIKVAGTHPLRENPLKNQMLLAMAIDYGVQHGAATYACGNCVDDQMRPGAKAESVKEGMTDYLELQVAAKTVFERLIPAITVRADLLATKADSFFTLADYAPQTLRLSGGCILPPFRRPNPRKANIRKYGAEVLLPGQCGSCYKCCCEYAFYAKMGGLPMHPAYYQRCLEIADTHFDTLTNPYGTGPSTTYTDGVFAGHRLDPKWLRPKGEQC